MVQFRTFHRFTDELFLVPSATADLEHRAQGTRHGVTVPLTLPQQYLVRVLLNAYSRYTMHLQFILKNGKDYAVNFNSFRKVDDLKRHSTI